MFCIWLVQRWNYILGTSKMTDSLLIFWVAVSAVLISSLAGVVFYVVVH